VTAPERYRAVWGEEDMVHFPGGFWIEKGVPAEALPEGDEIPTSVAALYTSSLEGDIELYETIRLTAEDADLDISFVAVGALQGNADLLFVMEPETGGLFQLDLEHHDVRGVNSTFRLFVESLYHFARFADDGEEEEADRPRRVAELRRTFERLDPGAFQEEAWWPLVFDELAA
jgi:hypothetical protein